MTVHKKQTKLGLIFEFIRLQLAGNILFLGTLGGVFVSDFLTGVHPMVGLIVGSLCAHIVFFIVNRKWVFTTSTADRHSLAEIIRFVTFMTFNFFLNILLVEINRRVFAILAPDYAAYAYYAGVAMAGLFFMIWSYIGLKFWVFAPVKRHAKVTRHHAPTLERRRRNEA